MSYATAEEFLVRYDKNRVGELVRDDNRRSSESDLIVDLVLEEILADASGMIEAAVLAGGRYSLDDLAGFTGNAQKMLVRLTCDIAFGLLVQRRGYSAVDNNALAPGADKALGILKKIEDGAWVFPTEAALAASKPTRAQVSKNVNMITGVASRYYASETNPNGSIQS